MIGGAPEAGFGERRSKIAELIDVGSRLNPAAPLKRR
jgi:hypothetical protein